MLDLLPTKQINSDGLFKHDTFDWIKDPQSSSFSINNLHIHLEHKKKSKNFKYSRNIHLTIKLKDKWYYNLPFPAQNIILVF